MRICLLDDNPALCDMLQEALKLAGHHAHVYDKPMSLLATITQERFPSSSPGFDLLIIDLLLPGTISGLQIIRYMKRLYPDLPVILISAASRVQIEAALEEVPDVRAFRKPFKISDLLTAFQEAGIHQGS
jgi:DNA-binding response OmpR family regulator